MVSNCLKMLENNILCATAVICFLTESIFCQTPLKYGRSPVSEAHYVGPHTTTMPNSVQTQVRPFSPGSPLLDDPPNKRASAISFGPEIFRNYLRSSNAPMSGLGDTFSRFGAPYFVPVPIVIPPPPPPPPGPKCFTNPSGYLCCNTTLQTVMVDTFKKFQNDPSYSSCNVQKMAGLIQQAAENKFKTSFETLAGHKDFAARSHFSGDLNCKIEIGGKYLLAFATPTSEPQVQDDITIIDGNNFFGDVPGSGMNNQEAARIRAQLGNPISQKGPLGNISIAQSGQQVTTGRGRGTNAKPTYLIYGPIRR